MLRPVIVVPEPVRLTIHYACVEVFPREAFGWLIGYSAANQWVIEAAIPTQIVSSRSRYHVELHVDSVEAQDMVIDERAIGDFHSHPAHGCTPSGPDRAEMLESEPDGQCFLIAEVYPSKRQPSNFRLKLGGYVVLGGRVRRAEIE